MTNLSGQRVRRSASTGGTTTTTTEVAQPTRLLRTQLAQIAVEFSQQAEKLSHKHPSSAIAGQQNSTAEAVAVEAHFVTPQDPVIVTSDGNRLPGVPLEEAHKLNILREELESRLETVNTKAGGEVTTRLSNTKEQQAAGHKVVRVSKHPNGPSIQRSAGGSLRRQMPPSHTNPLFPPLPLYGPPSLLRDLECLFFRASSAVLSLAFLGVIVLGSLFTSIPLVTKTIWYKATLRDVDKDRPFYEEEKRRAKVRAENERAWEQKSSSRAGFGCEDGGATKDFPPTEGGKDPIICDIAYYARRVGLDVEKFKVQTEDGFIIDLWHVYNPQEYVPLSAKDREHLGPSVSPQSKKKLRHPERKRRFPVLLMHGLLQSAGAYCCNDDESLAFWLCKSGYDVWLGNNRCGFEPKHTLLDYGDPRMWCWNIRQMGVFDLTALTSRVIFETGIERLGLVCHSQGTTQTFVTLAKEQRPDLGEKLTVFCALAPAAYAGPLIGKMYFKFMRVITPAMFRLMFGIHAFIPFMMQMHALLDPRIYGWLGYKVFSFLFDWSDARWDRGLRDRMFQFAPVYVSSESMRWWLGRECFAKHKCILSTMDIVEEEDRALSRIESDDSSPEDEKENGSTAWYNHQVPPFALWVCGNDDLVDGRRLIRRFEAGREPHVQVVHSKIIEEYEHLDVIWAMDAKEQVFKEVREVLWKTCPFQDVCRTPTGCEDVERWVPEINEKTHDNSSDGSLGS